MFTVSIYDERRAARAGASSACASKTSRPGAGSRRTTAWRNPIKQTNTHKQTYLYNNQAYLAITIIWNIIDDNNDK